MQKLPLKNLKQIENLAILVNFKTCSDMYTKLLSQSISPFFTKPYYFSFNKIEKQKESRFEKYSNISREKSFKLIKNSPQKITNPKINTIHLILRVQVDTF